MQYDSFGRAHVTEDDLCGLLYENAELKLDQFLVDNPARYNQSVTETHTELPLLSQYQALDLDVDTFDHECQQRWLMPKEYCDLDIAQWVLDQCKSPEELQRVGKELMLFQEKNLFSLLCYLKYLVDTMRKNKIVWGVGRGSSVASYVLYLIGIHKINSLYYDLPIEEFLKDEK